MWKLSEKVIPLNTVKEYTACIRFKDNGMLVTMSTHEITSLKPRIDAVARRGKRPVDAFRWKNAVVHLRDHGIVRDTNQPSTHLKPLTLTQVPGGHRHD
ncbi:hypothetical protein AC480_00145 [miscellaneous Crenarchaeota group archaeon SMTZ1-55]|nr:MAG: hypothetical protein AC480_00145 [miscellaneous Crenarchaeota group archaeon SMTZ1-55]